jgi:hypothetical protein
MTRLPGYAVSMHEDCSREVRRVGASIKSLAQYDSPRLGSLTGCNSQCRMQANYLKDNDELTHD